MAPPMVRPLTISHHGKVTVQPTRSYRRWRLVPERSGHGQRQSVTTMASPHLAGRTGSNGHSLVGSDCERHPGAERDLCPMCPIASRHTAAICAVNHTNLTRRANRQVDIRVGTQVTGAMAPSARAGYCHPCDRCRSSPGIDSGSPCGGRALWPDPDGQPPVSVVERPPVSLNFEANQPGPNGSQRRQPTPLSGQRATSSLLDAGGKTILTVTWG